MPRVDFRGTFGLGIGEWESFFANLYEQKDVKKKKKKNEKWPLGVHVRWRIEPTSESDRISCV